MASQKRVLIIAPSLFLGGGLGKCAVETARKLSKEYEVRIIKLSSDLEEYKQPEGVGVYDLHCPSVKSKTGKVLNQIKRSIKVKKLRDSFRPDYVYSFGGSANLTNVLSAMCSCGKIIISIHGYACMIKSKSYEFVYRHSDAVVCIAKAMKHRLLELYPGLNNVALIENGHDIDTIFKKSQEEIDHNLPGAPRYITVGRLVPGKGYERMINAFAQVHETFPEATLTLIGQGELEESLKQRAARLGIEDYVRFEGFQENPLRFLSKVDIFVFASLSEGFPNVLIEALACGLPVISVDCMSGPREILSAEYSDQSVKGIQNAEFGMLVEEAGESERTEKLLAEAMLQMASDDALRNRYRERARERAQEYSIDRYADKVKALFDKLDQ